MGRKNHWAADSNNIRRSGEAGPVTEHQTWTQEIKV